MYKLYDNYANYCQDILFLYYFYDIINNFPSNLNNALDAAYIIYFPYHFGSMDD